MRAAALVLAALAVVPRVAGAQPYRQPPDAASMQEPQTWARSQSSRVGLEIDVWPARVQFFDVGASILTMAVTPVAQVRLVDDVYMVADLPLGRVAATLDREPQEVSVSETRTRIFTIGNPTLGGYWTKMVGDRVATFVGATVSVPTLLDRDENIDRAGAASMLIQTRAYYDMHRWAPQFMPVRLLGGAEFRLLPNLYYRADVAPAFYVPLQAHPAEVVIDQGNELELRADIGAGGGVRFQEAILPTTPEDRIQTAAELFAAYEQPDEGVYARLGCLVALDETDFGGDTGGGFGFEEGRLAMFRASVGGKW